MLYLSVDLGRAVHYKLVVAVLVRCIFCCIICGKSDGYAVLEEKLQDALHNILIVCYSRRYQALCHRQRGYRMME